MLTKHEKTTREKFNNLKKYYDETWDITNHTLHVGVFANKKDSLEDAYTRATEYIIEKAFAVLPLDNKSKVLDIGCGTGRTLIDICITYGCSGVGVDLSDEQIRDAKSHLQKINRERKKQNLPKIKARFIRGSASELDKVFKSEAQFTHIISQDAIFLIINKRSLFENVYRLLTPGGVFVSADFLAESAAKKMNKKEQSLIYRLVNWDAGISFSAYQHAINTVGLLVTNAEERSEDMVLTYSKLAQKMKRYETKKDSTYTNLKERYQNVASATKNKKMGWGVFTAVKPTGKTALITGTKKKSIGRFIAKMLHNKGWDVWLYSRSAQKIDHPFWHERECDITDERSINTLLKQIPCVDLVMMLADTGTGHGSLENLSERGVKEFVDAKIIGSILLIKALLVKYAKQSKSIKVIWCAGKATKKPKHITFYSVINSGLASLVDQINDYYKETIEAYYLPTTLISPSTLGDKYIEKMGKKTKKFAQHPQTIANKTLAVVDEKIIPGMIDMGDGVL